MTTTRKGRPRPLTDSELVDFYGSVVEFAECLHLDVVAMAARAPLPVEVLIEVLGHKLLEEVHVL